MNRSNPKNKQSKQEQKTRNQSRSIAEKNKSQSQTRNKNEKLIINPQKGINVGKRTGVAVKKKDSGLNYDGTEKVSDYFSKQHRLSIEIERNSDAKDKSNSQQGDTKVSSLSDLQDDSNIIKLLNKRDSLSDFDLSPDQSLSDRNSIARQNLNNTNKGAKQLSTNQFDNQNNELYNGDRKNSVDLQRNKIITGKSEENRQSKFDVKQQQGNILEVPSSKCKKTSSFRIQRSQNKSNRNSIALSSIAKIRSFSGRMLENQSDFSSDRLDDFELLGQISNIPPELIAQNLQHGSSLNDTPFTKNIEDFEISLSESEISQVNQQDQSEIKQQQRSKKQQNEMDLDDIDDAEISQLMKKNKQIISQMSQRKKMNASNSFNSCLLDISESRIYKSAKTFTNTHDFGQVSPIQEVNTQQSNKKDVYFDDKINKRNRTEITIEPSEYQSDSLVIMSEQQNLEAQSPKNKNKNSKSDNMIIEFDNQEIKQEINVKQDEKSNSYKKLKPNILLQQNIDQQNISDKQEFVFHKVKRSNKRNLSHQIENVDVNYVQINKNKLSAKQQKQLKKNTNSLDSSDVILQDVLEDDAYKQNHKSDIQINDNNHNQLINCQKFDSKSTSPPFKNDKLIDIGIKESDPTSRKQNKIQQDKMSEENNQSDSLQQQKQNKVSQKNEDTDNERQELIYNYMKHKRNSTDIYLQLNNTEQKNQSQKSPPPSSSNSQSYQENFQQMIDEKEYKLQNSINLSEQDLKIESNQDYDQVDEFDYYKNNSQNNEQLRQSPSNKQMDVENVGVLEKVEEKNQSIDQDINRGRIKRKTITPEKLRNQSPNVSHTSDTDSQNSEKSASQANKIQVKKIVRRNISFNSTISQRTDSTQNPNRILKKLRKPKSSSEKNKLELLQYQWIYEKGFHKDQVEVEIKPSFNTFGNGRYPVRKRIRPLDYWREAATYGKEGLISVKTDQDSNDLTSVNYTIPGFSNVSKIKITTKEKNSLLQSSVNTSSIKKLDEIKEEDVTDKLKSSDSALNKKEKIYFEEKQSQNENKIQNSKEQSSRQYRSKSSYSPNHSNKNQEEEEVVEEEEEEEEEKEEIKLAMRPKENKIKQTLNSSNESENKSTKGIDKKNKKDSFDSIKEQSNDEEMAAKLKNANTLKLQKQQSMTKDKLHEIVKSKGKNKDQDIIKQFLQSDDLDKFKVQVVESNSDLLMFTFILNPGQEINDSSSQYRIEMKVIECSWKKLVLSINDKGNYLKQDDKQIIKKGSRFSIKYKQNQNNKNSTINVVCFKNSNGQKQSKLK